MRLFARAVRAATVRQRAVNIVAIPAREKFFDKIVVVVCHASLLPSVVRIHPPAADEIGHGGSDRIRLLNDQEMPGARDIDDLHPLTQLIPQRVSVGGRGDDVIETLNHQERGVAAGPPFVPWHSLAGRQVRNVNLRRALD